MRPTLRSLLPLALLALGPRLQALQALEATGAPVAVLECDVPDLDRFVVHGPVPLPPGFHYRRAVCPFTIHGPSGPLLTQWEPISYRADGSLMTVELLAYTPRGALVPDTKARFPVHLEESSDPLLDLDPDALLLQHLRLRAVDAAGNEYFGQPQFVRAHRFGAVQFTGEWVTRLLPADAVGPFLLEQLGAAQIWLSTRRNSNVVELALNFHNGSSQHPSWHLYFRKLQLILPAGWEAISMWPEARSGETVVHGEVRALPLVDNLDEGQMHFLEQRHERGFRYMLFPMTEEHLADAYELRVRKGWARALDLPRGDDSRTWSFLNPETPGYFPQALPMPDLGHVQGLEQRLIDEKRNLFNQLFTSVSVGPGEPIPLEGGYRNPHGVPYGGMTGGVYMHAYEGMETLWSSERRGLLHAYGVLRCYNDRQPGAMYEDSGLSFDPTRSQYLHRDGTQPYRLFNNVFQTTYPNITHDQPWQWHLQDRWHEEYLESNGLVAPYRDALVNFDPIDTQHMWRYSRMIKMLVYLDNDPMARRRMEAACELLRATYYDGPGGRLRNYLNGPSAIGAGFGREHAAAGDFAAAAYACGNAAWRQRWKPWFELYVDVLDHVQSPGGVWQALTSGKVATAPPLGNDQVAFYRAMRPNEHVFTQHALRGVKEAVFSHGVDPVRYERAREMLEAAGAAVWRLLWMWKEDLSGPAAGATWDRVAVGEIGPNPTMFVDHNDLPPEQFMDGLGPDGFRTGLALTYWLTEAESVTAEMLAALEEYSGTTDFLGATMAQGVSNIWNNAVLLALLQNFYR